MSRPRRPASTSTHRYPRTARLSESLREVIAEELTRIDDERLSLVTITAIDVDPEMNRAVVYFDSLVGEDGDAEILQALGERRIKLQGAVGRQIRSKKTPILSFQADQTIRAAERIERILHDDATMPQRPASADDESGDNESGDNESGDDESGDETGLGDAEPRPSRVDG